MLEKLFDSINLRDKTFSDKLGDMFAVRHKKEIPQFTGELNSIKIDGWFDIAERVARTAGWNWEQKIAYFGNKFAGKGYKFYEKLVELTEIEPMLYNEWKQEI